MMRRILKRSHWATWMLTVAMLTSASSYGADAGYHVVARYRLAARGKAGAVIVDSESRRLYVTCGSQVEVLNLDTGARIGAIPVGGANDVVLAPELKRGFISNGDQGAVTMFDTATLKVIQSIKLTYPNPGAMAYEPESKRIYVAGRGGVAVIDADSHAVEGDIPMDGQLRQLASSGYGRLYVAAEDQNVIHVADTEALKFLGDFPIGTGTGPTGVAIDPSGRRLFVACSNGRLPVIDTDIGFTFDELPIGKGDATDVFTFTPQGKGGWRGAAFVASSDGTLSLVRMNAFINYSSGGELKLPRGIQSVAFDPQTHKLFVLSGDEILVVGQ